VSSELELDEVLLVTKSSMDRANTIMNEAKMAGPSIGSSTRNIAPMGGAPRSMAASSYSLPIPNRRPRITTTT
jgi:hypothetical protein